MNPFDENYETLSLEQPEPGIVVLTLNRPERFNAMTARMFDELERVALGLDQDDEIRAVVLTGAGKAFCSGYDLADADALPGLGALGMLELQERAARALLALRTMRVPLIGAINGPAAGGGFSLALACDVRIASPAATFNAAFVKIGLTAGDLGVSWLLPRLIGPAHASEICFTGRSVQSEEAALLGLVNSVAAADAVVEESIALAREIATNSPGGVQLSKRALQANLEVGSYAAALELENRGQALMTRTNDMSEALAAFKERRRPVFTGS